MKKVISGEVRAQLCGDIFCAIFEYYFTKGTFNKPNPVPLRKNTSIVYPNRRLLTLTRISDANFLSLVSAEISHPICHF